MTPFNRDLAHTLAAEGWYADNGPAGWEGIRAEELLHCQGYMDLF